MAWYLVKDSLILNKKTEVGRQKSEGNPRRCRRTGQGFMAWYLVEDSLILNKKTEVGRQKSVGNPRRRRRAGQGFMALYLVKDSLIKDLAWIRAGGGLNSRD